MTQLSAAAGLGWWRGFPTRHHLIRKRERAKGRTFGVRYARCVCLCQFALLSPGHAAVIPLIQPPTVRAFTTGRLRRVPEFCWSLIQTRTAGMMSPNSRSGGGLISVRLLLQKTCVLSCGMLHECVKGSAPPTNPPVKNVPS